MIRYIIAHWRGELSLVQSFLVNGILGYVVLLAVLVGGSHVLSSRAFEYAGIGIFAAWQVWSLVGILRCVLRIFREPHSIVQRIFAALVLAAVAMTLYAIIGDLKLIVRTLAR